MSVLYFLEGLRCSLLDGFFSFITLFGEETLFIVIAMVIFWCFDKRQGYFLFCVGIFGTVINQFLKMVCRVPRPWVRDPAFSVVESAKAAATGYSFPSGHTQSAIGLFGGIARWNRQRAVRIAGIAMCVLVPLSRMYLGVHTPADVLTSAGIALILVFVGYPLFQKAAQSPKIMVCILSVIALGIAGHLLFFTCYTFPAPVYEAENIQNLESAIKNACTLLGCMLGLITVYCLDEKVIHFPTKAVWWAQLLKIAGGLLLVLAIQSLLKTPLDALFDGHMIARVIRYFLVVVVGGGLWPLTFRRFEKLGKAKA